MHFGTSVNVLRKEKWGLEGCRGIRLLKFFLSMGGAVPLSPAGRVGSSYCAVTLQRLHWARECLKLLKQQRVAEALGAATNAHALGRSKMIGSYFSFYSIFLKKHKMAFCSIAVITVTALDYNMKPENDLKECRVALSLSL